MLYVLLADTAIMVKGWTRDLDFLGAYTLRERKTPEEIREEKERRKIYNRGQAVKVNNMKYTNKSVISKSEDDPSIVYFLPGLWPRVKEHLDKNGIAYEIDDRRNPDIRPEINYESLAGIEFRENQDVALALIASADCGIIETATAWGKSFLISVVCKALPTLNILVCTSSTTVVSTLYEYLCKQLPGEVGIICGTKNTSHNKRVVVSTLKSVTKINPEHVHLLLCDECHDVGDNMAGRELMKFCFARRFGFSASPVRNDGSALVMESIFGPTILRMTYEESVEAGMVTPMKYLMMPCKNGPSVCQREGLPDVFMKRYAYWANNYRNKLVQDIVYDIKKVSDCQILIMVATLEHAIYLHMLLPWFKVAYYGATEISDLRKRFPKEKYPNLDLNQYKMNQKQLDIMRNAFAKGTLRYVISTTVFRQGVNFTKLQVLVRCDGTTSKVMGIQIPGRLARLAEDKDYAYLIDFNDTFCSWAAGRSRARKSLYAEQQWIEATREEVLNDLRTKSVDNTEHSSGELLSHDTGDADEDNSATE